MLEKEAEEYFKSVCEDYNEEYERTGKRHYFVGFDIKNAYIAGCNKSNEWHYVKDGDLPKEDLRPRTLGYYLTASKHKSYKGFVFEVAYFTGVIFTKGGDILDNVIAWKEIVLPKESE